MSAKRTTSIEDPISVVVSKPKSDARGEGSRVQHTGGGKLVTKQEHALDTDVNAVVARFRSGIVSVQSTQLPRYGDFTGVSTTMPRCLPFVQQRPISWICRPTFARRVITT